MKNSFFFSLLLILSINFYACKKENAITNISTQNLVFQNYSEIHLEKVKINENEKNIVYQLKSSELEKTFLNLDLEKESATLELAEKKIPTDFNFSYDIDMKDAINEIKILKNKNGNLIFLFPTATEEYLTFQILKYNHQNKTFYANHFYFETHENIRDLYLNSKANLSEKNNSYVLEIGAYQFKGAFQNKLKEKNENN